MAFAVPQPYANRLKQMEPSGKEVREGWDPMDMSYMQLLEGTGLTEDAPAEVEETPPDPGEIIKVFEDAKGNLDVIVDVMTNLERSFLEAKPFSGGRRPGVIREDAVANSLQSRVAATSASLSRVSSRLADGAALLKAHVEREDRFYSQLRQLQMFWKVHLNPRVIDCPFMVDLALPEPHVALGAAGGPAGAATASSVAAGSALTGNTYELGGGSLLVPLMKDDSGALRVQLELPAERPDVNDSSRQGQTRLNGKGAQTQLVMGSRRVHALLLQLHRRQLWRQVAVGLERDAAALGLGAAAAGGGGAAGAAAAGPGGGVGAGGGAVVGSSGSGGGHPVHVSLARLASQNVLRTVDPCLAALRPLMLEHLLACRMPPPYKPPPRRPAGVTGGCRSHLPGHLLTTVNGAVAGGEGGGGGLLGGMPLLPDLAAALNQMVFRTHQIYHLDLEAHGLPYVTLRWRPCGTSMLTSAMEIRLGTSHRVLVLIRDGRTDVEGVVQATGPTAGSGAGGSRWVRDTHMGFSRHDVPCVLRSVLQTLGMPLDRLLGLHSTPNGHTQGAGGGGHGGKVTLGLQGPVPLGAPTHSQPQPPPAANAMVATAIAVTASDRVPNSQGGGAAVHGSLGIQEPPHPLQGHMGRSHHQHHHQHHHHHPHHPMQKNPQHPLHSEMQTMPPPAQSGGGGFPPGLPPKRQEGVITATAPGMCRPGSEGGAGGGGMRGMVGVAAGGGSGPSTAPAVGPHSAMQAAAAAPPPPPAALQPLSPHGARPPQGVAMGSSDAPTPMAWQQQHQPQHMQQQVMHSAQYGTTTQPPHVPSHQYQHQQHQQHQHQSHQHQLGTGAGGEGWSGMSMVDQQSVVPQQQPPPPSHQQQYAQMLQQQQQQQFAQPYGSQVQTYGQPQLYGQQQYSVPQPMQDFQLQQQLLQQQQQQQQRPQQQHFAASLWQQTYGGGTGAESSSGTAGFGGGASGGWGQG